MSPDHWSKLTWDTVSAGGYDLLGPIGYLDRKRDRAYKQRVIVTPADLVPLPIVALFTINYEFHNHFTRQSQSLHTAVGRNEAIYKTSTFHGIRIWNYISTKISADVLYASFKHSSKFLSKIPQHHIE